MIALFACWGHNVELIDTTGNPLRIYFWFNWRFWANSFANPAATSLTLDILVLGLALILFMLTEARRWNIPWVWAYIVLAVLVALSVTFPLFLAVREHRIAQASDAELAEAERVHIRAWEAAIVGGQLLLMLYIIWLSYSL